MSKLNTIKTPLAIALALSVCLMAPASFVRADDGVASGYVLPPPALQAVVDAPRAPQLLLSPRRNLAAMMQSPELPGIAEVAQPELKLAGMRINPRTYADSKFTFGSDLWLFDLQTQKESKIAGLPAPLRIDDMQWAPDQKHLAFTQVAAAGIELWVVDVAAKKAHKLAATMLNSVAGRGYSWMPDSSALLVQLRPAGQSKPPAAKGIPLGPNTQDSAGDGTARQLRTYPDLLKNEEDSQLFEHYLQSQLALIDLAGKTKTLGAPALFTSVAVAPGGKYVLTSSVHRPFSYVVSAGRFPTNVEVRDLTGGIVHTAAVRPLSEGLPPGADAVSPGARSISWRADADATLVWTEAQDGGDPAVNAEIRDIVYTQAAPFKAAPVVLTRLKSRFGGIVWGRGDLAILTESWRKTRATRRWRIAPDNPGAAMEAMRFGSEDDIYHKPGTPVTMPDTNGRVRLVIADGADGPSILLHGLGSSPEGDRPFLDRFNMKTKKSDRLFQSSAPNYEDVVSVMNADGTRMITTREAPSERPNYFIRDLSKSGDAQLTALTHFTHPTPQLKDVQKEVIRYKRADGVDLTATLYLPAGYDAKRDGPLPMLMWAYPREFKSVEAAGQVSGSPYRFNGVSAMSPRALLAAGYAVLDNPTMPIIGEGKKEPNDTYLPQLIASAEAAINEVVRRGVADRNKIAIGGHSYGAFMTANLLAHTRLFKAGIARSGAYNRTLTPFGFQSEERSFWQAKDVYQTMSPFNDAEKIKDAILFIHGEDDNNPGTFPIQSERMFQAVKGLGGTARLVMLPNESHAYRARESVLDMLAEMNSWLDKYVKNAKP